jgi:hypothetical protein
VPVGGDRVLVNLPGHFDLDVFVDGEHGVQVGVLLFGELPTDEPRL